MMKSVFWLSMLIFLIAAGPITWKQISSIRVGQLYPIQELMTQADTSETLTDHSFTFLNKLNGVVNATTDLQYGMSLFSYESWMTDFFSFNITMTKYNALGGTIRFVVHDITFILRAKVHYIIIHRPTSPANNNCGGTACNYNMQAIYGCYVTQTLADLATSTTDRVEQVGGLQTSQIAVAVGSSAISRLNIYTMITGLKLINNIGPNNYLRIDTIINSTTKLYHKISVQTNNRLVYFCATTIVIDPTIHQRSYVSIIESYTKDLTATNGGLSSIPFMERFDSQNRTFFGISQFNLSMNDVRYLRVETYNVSLIGQLYDTNSALNYMRYHLIFFAERSCENTNYTFYDPVAYICQYNCATVVSSYSATGTYLSNTTSKFCAPCHYSCLVCTSPTVCTQCPTASNRSNTATGNRCNCLSGYVDYGVRVCQLCSQYMSGCLTCTTKTFCTTCDNSKNYFLIPIDAANKICGCQNGSYNATGHCLTYPGCIDATSYNNIISCNECDTSKKFVFNITKDQCQCMFGYFPNTTLNKQTCSDICGDNVVAIGHCDDGNNSFGDGCDQNCEVEDGYDCSSTNTTTGGSICYQKDNIVITYLYAQKLEQSNKYKMVFSFKPTKYTLNAASFANKINTSLETQNQVFKFDPSNSWLIFENDYLIDIEGTRQHMNISFNNLSFFADPMTVYFTPIGINAQLVIDQYHSVYQIISIVLMVCILLAVILAIFASVVSLKMIGIQLIIPIQIIYFSLATVQNHRSTTAALKSLKYSSGFNSIVPYDYSRSYSQHKNLIGMGFETQFILTSNVFLVMYFMILFWLLFNHMKLRYKEYKLQQFLQENNLNDKKRKKQDDDSDEQEQNKEEQKDKQSSQEEQLLKERKVIDEEVQFMQSQLREDHHRQLKFFGFYVDRIYFIFYTLLMNQVFFSFFVMALGMPILKFSFSKQLHAILANISYFIFIGNLVFIYTDQQSSKMIVFTSINDRYVYYYYLLDFIIILILAMGFEYYFCVYIVTIISFCYIVLIVIEKPYSSIFLSLENIVVLYNHIMCFISLIIICLIASTSNLSEHQALLYTVFIVGLIVIGEILTTIRLVLKVNFKKAFEPLKNYNNPLENNKKQNRVIKKNLDLLQEEDKHLQILPSDEIKNGLFTPKDRMIDWQSKNSSDYHSYRNKQQHETNNIQEQDGLNNEVDSQNDGKINELDILKKKLRNNLKLKQQSEGKSKVN